MGWNPQGKMVRYSKVKLKAICRLQRPNNHLIFYDLYCTCTSWKAIMMVE